MAVEKILLSEGNFIKNSLEFESSVKEKLKWSKKHWIQAGEQGTRINKLCSSLKYWGTKLKPAIEDTSILITFFNEEKDERIDLDKIIAAIEKLNGDIAVQGISEYRNPRYIGIHFENKQHKDFVKDNFKMLDNSYVVYMSWALDGGSAVIALKVHWLPLTLDIEIIKKELEQYVQFIEEARTVRTLMSGRDVPTGKVTFKVIVNKAIKIEAIPHVTFVADMEALITIPGRAPLCLNCDSMGHISRDCKLRYCNCCVEMKPKQHQCELKGKGLSYAGVVKDGEAAIDPDDWGAAINLNYKGKTRSEQDLIAQKINGLEKKIQDLKAEESEHIILRLEKKRKGDEDSFDQAEQMESEGEASQPEAVEFSVGEGDWFTQTTASIDDSVKLISRGGKESVDETIAGKQKKSNKSSKSKKTGRLVAANIDNKESGQIIRSYGKPVFNARKRKEEEKFKAASETREFIFKE